MSAILDESLIEEFDNMNTMDMISNDIIKTIVFDYDEGITESSILNYIDKGVKPKLEINDIFSDEGDLTIDDTDPLDDPENEEDNDLIDMVIGGEY